MEISYDAFLAHYGVLRRSGRYPWGSGDNPTAEQKSRVFLDHVAELKRSGLDDTGIAKAMGMTTTELRNYRTIARNAEKQANITRAQRLKNEGNSNVAIGKEMGINESSVRSLLAEGAKEKADSLDTIANLIREKVDAEGHYIDIGAGVENNLGISPEKLKTAVTMLKEEGYVGHNVQTPQLTGTQKTVVKVLCPPGTTYKDVVTNMENIHQIHERSDDNGRTFSLGIKPPININPNRVAVNYDEDGGSTADGVIYVRPGVDDLSMGNARYAQVRIAVGGSHYLKGMAIYKDDLPDGIDLVFNTNKKKADIGDNKLDAMKALKDDPENPFGAIVRQLPKLDTNGNAIPDTVRSAMNIVNEEGDWQKWKKTISRQVLSKQSPILAKTQLDQMYDRKKAEYDEIMSLTNPAVRKRLLESFSDDVDSSAVHLKAAALPRQASQVILPVNSLPETQIYAPNYKNGERVALIRYPHGGTFEIPELTVNNNHKESKALLGRAKDAVGINSKVAERLSGADFDGDTVLVIPNNDGRLKSSPALKDLKNFDPQRDYKGYEGMPKMDARTKGIQMGLVSNLITDMTVMGAPTSELARAVKHSMVVIDAEKHGLNYRQSAIDHGIASLMKKYQGRSAGGANTLISAATARIDVPQRKAGFLIDKTTGKKIYRETGESYVDPKTGKTVVRTTKSQKLAETDDARTLLSGNGKGTPIENVYANHSNKLKALANQARKEMVNTESTPYSPSAKAAYSKEVRSLEDKLQVALMNRPRERQAQLIANTTFKMKKDANPEMEAAELKKLKSMALQSARERVGAKKIAVDITPREWEAIQAGAITNHKLNQILKNTNLDKVKELATPRTNRVMTDTMVRRAEALMRSGATQAEVAQQLGVALSTLKDNINV